MPPIAFPTDTTALDTLADAHTLLGDDGNALRDITALVVAQYIAAKGLAPAAGTPLANAINIEGLTSTLNAGTYATRAAFRAAARTPAYAGSVPTPADIATLPNFVANPSTVLAGTSLWVASTNSLWLLIVSPTAQAPSAFAPLANWVDLGANDGSGNGAVNVQAGALVASPTDAPNADAVLDALAVKANAVRASQIVPPTVTVLTRAPVVTELFEAPTGHYNRPLLIDTDKAVDSTDAISGDMLMVFNFSESVKKVTAGSLVVSIAPDTWGELTQFEGVWKNTSAASGAVRVYNAAPATNIAPNSTAFAIAAQFFVPSVGPRAKFALDFQSDASAAAGARQYTLSISATGDVFNAREDMGVLAVSAGNGRLDAQMRFFNTSANTQRGQSPNIVPVPYGQVGTAASRYVGSMDTSAGIYVTLLLAKSTAADVVDLQACQLVVTQ